MINCLIRTSSLSLKLNKENFVDEIKAHTFIQMQKIKDCILTNTRQNQEAEMGLKYAASLVL